MSKQISVIGCGWLGLPLAKKLVENSYIVKGSTTSKSKLKVLKTENIDAYSINISNKTVEGNIEDCLKNSTILILNIPPGLRKNPENNYVQQIKLLIPYIEKSSIEHIIFISSTSVYNDEESFPIITEQSKIIPNSESGKQIFEVEQLLQNNINFKTTILRFSGLFGEDRIPAKFLSGKTNLKNAEAPVNLIHQKDGIKIIIAIIEQGIWDETFNVSTTPHPTRKAYYTSQCRKLNLPLPSFELISNSKGKLIDSTKLVQILNYEFLIELE